MGVGKKSRGHKGRMKWPKDKRFGVGKSKVPEGDIGNAERERREAARAITKKSRRPKMVDLSRLGSRHDEILKHGGVIW